MKRLLLKYAGVTLLLILAITGSFAIPRRELRSTGQVAGIALDREGDFLRATFELYSPSLEEPIGKTRQTVTTMGETLQDCMDRAQRIGGETLFADDLSALVIDGGEADFLLEKVYAHYRLFKNDRMDLPVFFTDGQPAELIFRGEGAVLSGELAESGKSLRQIQTVRDLINGDGEKVLVRGEGSYEIIS